MSELATQPATLRFLVLQGHRTGGIKWRNERKIIRDFFQTRGIPCTIITFKRSRVRGSTLDFPLLLRESQANRVLVAGGDGTLRSIVEYFFFHHIKIPVGVLPVGSANILARSLGVPLKLRPALEHAIKAQPQPFGVGVLNGTHVFLLCACFGQVARFTLAADKYHKHTFGFFSYVLGAFRHLFTFPHRQMTLTRDAIADARTHAHSILFFPRKHAHALVPSLPHSEKSLQALVWHNASVIGFIRTFWEMYVLKRPSWQHVTPVTASKMELHADGPMHFHLDGDIVDDVSHPYSIELHENAVEFLI